MDRTIVIAGDFNIELLKDNKHKTQLISLMWSFQLFQTIFENTRGHRIYVLVVLIISSLTRNMCEQKPLKILFQTTKPKKLHLSCQRHSDLLSSKRGAMSACEAEASLRKASMGGDGGAVNGAPLRLSFRTDGRQAPWDAALVGGTTLYVAMPEKVPLKEVGRRSSLCWMG
nr:unnamed protein product [Callosobruchus analis]